MKKYLFMLAAFVAATATFTACSNEDTVTDSNENKLGEPVRAQFTISIPGTTGGVTRMASDIVQSSITNVDNDFRGINDISLYPSAIAMDDFDEDSPIGQYIYLRTMLKPNVGAVNQVIPQGKLYGNSKSVLYSDVQLNIGTRTFLFYGKAIGKTDSDVETAYTSDDFFKYGWLTKTMPANAANVSGFIFSPKAIINGQSTTDLTTAGTKRTAICTFLAQIANAQVDATHTWRGEENNAGLKALFTSFVGMTAGSSANLEVAVRDLYFTCKDAYDDYADKTTDVAKLVKAIYEAIYEETNNNTYVTVTGTGTERTLTFNANIAGYPSIIGLPDGAAVLSRSTDANGLISFAYVGGDDNHGDLNITNINQYAYPANLYYRGLSDILTSEDSQQDYFTESMTWDDAENTGIFNHYNPANTTVTSKTRSVILKKQVQYAVGRLDFSVVAVGSATGGKLADNGKGSTFHAIDPAKIKLTGILIGGQKNVGWDFTPIDGTEYTVYDNIVKSQDAATGLALSPANPTTWTPLAQTLVLETAGEANEQVNVALEFINNDQDFYGADGIVPKGCKFYLVGTLDMNPAANSGSTTTKPTGYTGDKVFKQDHVAIAKFKVKSLMNALNTIPDLRNPKVEMGLSVDLTWQEGVLFDIDIP